MRRQCGTETEIAKFSIMKIPYVNLSLWFFIWLSVYFDVCKCFAYMFVYCVCVLGGLFILMCLSVLLTCLSVYHVCAWCLWRSEQ